MRWLIVALGAGLAVSAVAQPWRYVDENGQIHYTNDILALPKKQRERILRKMGLPADAGLSVPVGRRPGRDAPDAGVQPVSGGEPAPRPKPETRRRPERDEAAEEARWRRLAREAREKIADAEHARETARLAFEQASRQALTVTSGPNLAAKAAAQKALEKAEADLAAARKALEDLEERARRAGAPPGWLR